jgi:Fic family protein
MTHLSESLDAFEKYLHAERRFDPLVESFLVHYQFEAIHPFGDGNGRVGRLLLAVTIAEWCRLANQWLYMSAFFESNRDRYVDLLFRVSTHGDWEAWVQFCLEGVVSESHDTERRCEKLLALYDDFRDRLKTGSVRLRMIADSLFDSAVLTVTQVRERFGVTYPTALADLKRLEKAGIVEELNGARQKTFFCGQIINITYENSE